MAETFDIAIVGAGITGCAIARQLARFDLTICVIEAANDIALGASKANGGLVHAGYDPAPGTVKAQVNARGCELYGAWAQKLGFLFCRTGSMVLGFNDEDRTHLEQLQCNGHINGVPELSIVGPDRIHELEPRASADATCALWCPSTGFVDPFEVAIAALENAVANGVTFMRSASVEAIEVAPGAGDGSGDGTARFTLVTPTGDVRCRYLINAAGNGAADISHMAGAEEFQMVWRQGNIVVLDKEPRALMPLYPVPTPISKGVIVTGTVHGNTVITATAAVREPGDTQTYADDVNALLDGARKLVPDLDTRRVVRAFAGGRPVIQGTNDFFIGQSAVVPGLFQAAGIQSPGVASAPAIAERMEQVLRDAGVALRERADWNPIRHAPDDFDRAPLARKEELIESNPAWGQIVCRCETVPEAEIVAAIRRRPSAVSVEGVKRRCRAGMGRCQSGFCQSRVVAILARELGCDPSEVLLEDAGSWLVEGPLKGVR
ncbi:MAG: NAD(P)/FAD-dependent oxidoreductase [Collinsella sp.]|nr:NAD(P)/FAD-dependent oxidoreductase [Collinsella sp.]